MVALGWLLKFPAPANIHSIVLPGSLYRSLCIILKRFLRTLMVDRSDISLFDKIVSGVIPCLKVYEDNVVLAFRDINPVAEHHVLIVPKERDGLDRINSAKDRHATLLGHMMLTIPKVAAACNLSDYRVVINNGPGSGQTVFHLHIHVIGGKQCQFKWPPV